MDDLGGMLIDNLIVRVIEQAPAIGALLYLVWRFEQILNRILDTCLKHMLAENEPKKEN